jgi:dihydropteroate synthase
MEVELDRVLPVIRSLAEAIAAEASGAVISVDTYKAAVAGHALKVGACIVNDVSACRFDPALLDVLVEEKPGYVLMHCPKRPKEMQKSPEYGNVVDDILFFFEERLKVLTDAGLPEENIVLDPGIGFGKTLEHNLAIMVGIERFAVLGRPLYIGLSNKSLWGKLLGSEPEDRLAATVAATAIMAARGVAVHRVHEVHETVQALGVVKALATAGAE